jgi:uncharacterized protein YjbJ (UPF0337 family)
MEENLRNGKDLTGTSHAPSALSGQDRKQWACGTDNAGEVPMGELSEKVKGNANEAAGNVKQMSGDPDTRKEGRQQEAKGEAQQLKGEIEGELGNDI